MKKVNCFLCVFVILIFAISCNSSTKGEVKDEKDYGEKISVDGTDVYYKDGVTKEEAVSLGTFLEESSFTNGKAKSVQIVKQDDTYQFRMVIKDGYEDDPEYIEMAEAYSASISSSVFHGAQVEMHLCDKDLETLRVVKMTQGVTLGYNKKDIDGIEFQYDNNVTEGEVDGLSALLVDTGFAEGEIIGVLFLKEYLGHQLFLEVAEENYTDEAFREYMQSYSQRIADEILDGQRLEVNLCDEYLSCKGMIIVN